MLACISSAAYRIQCASSFYRAIYIVPWTASQRRSWTVNCIAINRTPHGELCWTGVSIEFQRQA